MPGDNHLSTRELVCELCRHFFLLGWVTGTGGSISIRQVILYINTTFKIQEVYFYSLYIYFIILFFNREILYL